MFPFEKDTEELEEEEETAPGFIWLCWWQPCLLAH